MIKTFRFDDVCCNADMGLIKDITNLFIKKYPDCKVIWAVSPLVFDMRSSKTEKEKQRVFPKILNAHSDYREHYKVDKAYTSYTGGKNVVIASHGLCHVDHRLLDRSAQEMSILISCSLTKSNIFVPPFNKWNKDTENICDENGIELVKFESGWKCIEYNEFDSSHDLWYLHAREFTVEQIKKWLR